MTCLIGYTGLVGSNLCAQGKYDLLINSKNSIDMSGKHFSKIVCAGVSGTKWKANANPDEDLAKIKALEDVLSTVEADEFVLISSIDVYPDRGSAVDEDFVCTLKSDNHSYGKHRLMFEEFCKAHFNNCIIVRLPGLFGTGLKKNIVFDLMNDNCLDMVNPKSTFQYYFLDDIADDIQRIEDSGLKLVNLFSEPISTEEINSMFFNNKNIGSNPSPEVHYDIHTKNSFLHNLSGNYMYTKEEMLKKLEIFINRSQKNS